MGEALVLHTAQARRRCLRIRSTFVLARLEREGLTPSSEASRETLLRRVTLDLTGLPPTPAEVDAFLPTSPRRLREGGRSPARLTALRRAHGHRWLDAARYADTNGYQTDAARDMWRWRDWVIDAFNRNLPFDRFTIEQIAGDMLPGATLDQKIASGFNRNHRGNAEGGIIPEEYAVEYVVDRVETTSTVWLGLTLGCARCHDHKYDPFTQKEFYQVFAYFNNVPEIGRGIKYGNSPPVIPAPTDDQRAALDGPDQRIQQIEAFLRDRDQEIARAQTAWSTPWPRDRRDTGRLARPLSRRTHLIATTKRVVLSRLFQGASAARHRSMEKPT